MYITGDKGDPAHSPLSKPAEEGDVEGILTILEATENKKHIIDKSDELEMTPLQRACLGRHDEVVKILLEHGARVNTGIGRLTHMR